MSIEKKDIVVKELTPLEKESEKRKKVLKEKRAEYSFNLTRNGRRISALTQLEKQLESGMKPVKGGKPFKININGDLEYEELKDGTKKPIRLSLIPLSPTDKIRIAKTITSLKRKLKIA